MKSIQQFNDWARPYTSHRQTCLQQCQPNRPNCLEGYKIARKCISLGPIAWFKENHEDICPTCHSGGFFVTRKDDCGANKLMVLSHS
jgi:hypothetical protein